MIKVAEAVSTTAPTMGPELPILVLFGRSATGRPRAAWFSAADADAATVAAGAAKLRTHQLSDGAERELGGQFARGRVLQSGKIFVPFAQRDLYGRFTALVGDQFSFSGAGRASDGTNRNKLDANGKASLGEGEGAKTSGQESDLSVVQVIGGVGGEDLHRMQEPTPPQPGDPTFNGKPIPRSPEEVGLGSVVLAHEGADEGWWEAEVIAFNGRVYSLRWRDYPLEPTILRRPTEVALLPSEVA